MKTVGQMLKEKRLEKNIRLETVEKETKIRKKFLEYIEADNYANFPSLTYTQGFIKNYSEYLGLNSKTMMAFFRRQTKENARSTILPKGIAEPLNKPRNVLTPGRFLALFFVIIFGIFLFYFGYQYYSLQVPPNVIIESPKDQTTVTTNKRIDVIGTTDPDATVTINGIGVLVRSDGKFFDQVALFPGENTITIVVTSRYGKSTTVTRTVKVEE